MMPWQESKGTATIRKQAQEEENEACFVALLEVLQGDKVADPEPSNPKDEGVGVWGSILLLGILKFSSPWGPRRAEWYLTSLLKKRTR